MGLSINELVPICRRVFLIEAENSIISSHLKGARIKGQRPRVKVLKLIQYCIAVFLSCIYVMYYSNSIFCIFSGMVD